MAKKSVNALQKCDIRQMKVSVFMTTYNHERFVAKAIESVLMQKTSFDYEVVIGEDCSTDGTREICESYAKSYPHLVRLLPSDRNLGMMLNFVRTWQECAGDYIAWLDGDDYWISEYKLQVQVEFLDANPECVMCFTDAVGLNDQPIQTTFNIDAPDHIRKEHRTTIDQVIRINPIPSCTAIYKGSIIGHLPDFFGTLQIADWPLSILILQYGDCGFIAERTACYRLHAGAGYSTLNEIAQLQREVVVCETLERYVDRQYRGLITKTKAVRQFKLLRRYLSQNDYHSAYYYLRASLSTIWIGPGSFSIVEEIFGAIVEALYRRIQVP